jgi:hypothetical protein
VTLKQAAENLNINYSTAKTILQTFRRERRISKKPKHIVETKKAMKRENYLAKVLTHARMNRVVSNILSNELKLAKKRKSSKASRNLSEVQTAMNTEQAIENQTNKGFPRIGSAGQMELFGMEKEGPKEGQVTRAVTADIPLLPKKELFYIYSKDMDEEEFRRKIDYDDPVALKVKVEEQPNNEVINLPSVSAFTHFQKHDKEEVKVKIDFSVYRKAILETACKRYNWY